MSYDRDALARELDGYERSGKTERAAQVRALLRAMSGPVVLDEPPVEQATAAPGEKRTTRRGG